MLLQFGRQLVDPQIDRRRPRRRHLGRHRHERRCPTCHDRGVVRIGLPGSQHWATCPDCGRSDQD